MTQFDSPRINAREAKVPATDQAFLDMAVRDITTIVNTAATSLSAQLSANGYTKIRSLALSDNPDLKEAERRTLIDTAASAETATLLPQAKADLARVVNYTRASTMGLDPTRVKTLVERELERQLKAAVAQKMTESHQEVVKLRADFKTTLKNEANKLAREIAEDVAVGVTAHDSRELKSLLQTRKINMPRHQREKLIDKSADIKMKDVLLRAATELESRVPLAQAVALGLDQTEEKEASEAALKAAIRCQIKEKLSESYDLLCDESRARAQVRADRWGWAKVLAPAAVLVATGATIALLEGTTVNSLGPAGAALTALTFLFCESKQRTSVDNHLG